MPHAHAHHHPGKGPNGHVVSAPSIAHEIRSLDDLASMSNEELAALYGRGRHPQLGALAGDVRGRVLGVPSLARLPVIGRALGVVVSRFGRAPFVPWLGKHFDAPSDGDHAHGHNRLAFEVAVLPFDAQVAKSVVDHESTLAISYDRPDVPAPFRGLRGELREISRGVYLGPLTIPGPNGRIVLLWWGCARE